MSGVDADHVPSAQLQAVGAVHLHAVLAQALPVLQVAGTGLGGNVIILATKTPPTAGDAT
jgi:hypothetical protein